MTISEVIDYNMFYKWRLVVYLIFISTLLTSCTLLSKEETLPPPLIPRVEAVPLKTMIVEKGDIAQYARFYGNVTTIRQHDLYLQIPSAVLSEHNIDQRVNRDFANEAEQIMQIIQQQIRVEAGDILAVFTNENIEKKTAPLQRAVELARINYNAAVREKEEANVYYTELQEVAERDRQNAGETYEAMQTLYQIGDISAAELTKAKTEYENTVLDLERDLREAKAAAENSDDIRRESINLAAAEEDLRNNLDQIESFVIRAPVAGIISFYTDLFIGDTYTSDQLLFTIAEESSFYVTVVLTEAEMSLDNPFTLGAEVEMSARTMTNSGFGTTNFKGMVVMATNDQKKAAASSKNTIMIEAYEWPEQIDLTTPNIEVRVVKASSHDVVVIPLNAVYMTGNYSYVRIVEEGVSREQPVELGIISGIEVEIVNGLTPGEEIALK